MKKFLIFLLVFLVVAAGLGYLLCPTILDQVARGNNDSLKARYRSKVEEMTADQIDAFLNAAASYNAEMEETSIGDVFSGKAPRSTHSYQHLLNVTDGVIGTLEIPRIGVSLPVYHSGTDRNAEQNLIHVSGSALPADAPGAHVILAGPGIRKADGFLGDIGLTGSRMLQDLDQVVPGDLMMLQVLDRTMVYQVEGVQTLTPEGVAALDNRADEDTEWLTVVTERGDRRLLAQGKRIQISEAAELLEAGDGAKAPSDPVNILALGSPVFLLGLLVILIIERFKRHAYRLPVNMKNAMDADETS